MRFPTLFRTLAVIPLLAGALPAAAHANHDGSCCECSRKNQEKAERAIARKLVEDRTGGIVVAMRRTRINGSTRWGFEADVHMPGKTKGWLALVDMDMPPKVYSTREIPNPPAPKEGHAKE